MVFVVAPGAGVDAQSVVQALLGRLGTGGFSHVHGAPVVAPKGGSDALLPFEDPANGVPVRVLAGFAQAPADHLYELVGDDGDEQMTFGAYGLELKDGGAIRARISATGRPLRGR